MNCKKTQFLLSSYLDNELSAEEKELLQGHLALCPECSRELSYQKKMKEILSYKTSDVENLASLPYFETRLLNKIRQRASSYDDFTVSARKAVLAGSFLTALFAGMFLLNIYSTNTANKNMTTDDYLLQSASNNVEKKVFVESNISEDDVISLAFNNTETHFQ